MARAPKYTARTIPMKRRFNGKTYERKEYAIHAVNRSKADANKKAARFRKAGYKARIVSYTIIDHRAPGHKARVWVVYVRR